MRLKDKVAVVTGAAMGIGQGIAKVFAEEGAKVVVADMNEDAGNETTHAINTAGGEATFVRTNMLVKDEINAMVVAALATYGKLDVVVNNAGTHIAKTAEDLTEDEWNFVIDLNLKALWLSTKFALPHLKATKGNIVHMASAVGLVGQERSVVYTASKGGVISMTKAMALDFAEYGIRVNCICPCAVETPLFEKWLQQQDDPELVRQQTASYHLFPRMITPEEIGHAAAYLASDEAAMITGLPLPVDGGSCLGYRRAE